MRRFFAPAMAMRGSACMTLTSSPISVGVILVSLFSRMT